jgi:hypothetical protein
VKVAAHGQVNELEVGCLLTAAKHDLEPDLCTKYCIGVEQFFRVSLLQFGACFVWIFEQ